MSRRNEKNKMFVVRKRQIAAIALILLIGVAGYLNLSIKNAVKATINAKHKMWYQPYNWGTGPQTSIKLTNLLINSILYLSIIIYTYNASTKSL